MWSPALRRDTAATRACGWGRRRTGTGRNFGSPQCPAVVPGEGEQSGALGALGQDPQRGSGTEQRGSKDAKGEKSEAQSLQKAKYTGVWGQ